MDTGPEAPWLAEADPQAIGIDVCKPGQGSIVANGRRARRDVGIAVIRSGEFKTVDEVAFGNPDGLLWPGARRPEGFAAGIEPREKRLVAAGPIPIPPRLQPSPGGHPLRRGNR